MDELGELIVGILKDIYIALAKLDFRWIELARYRVIEVG